MTGRWTLFGLSLFVLGGGTALASACITPNDPTTTTTATAVASVASEATIDSSCLQRTASNIYVPKVTSGTTNRISIADNKTADFRNKTLTEDPPQYGLVVQGMGSNACITGLKMIGRASTSLTWKTRKGSYDGDGVLFKYMTGSPAIVERVHFYNIMDGVSPRASNSEYRWHARGAYMAYIRDDAIENDQCLAGTFEDSLVDGVFMAFSARPSGTSHPPCPSGYQDNTLVIKNVYLRLECQPHNSTSSGCSGGNGVGQLFKWRSGSPIPVDVRDSIFVQPAMSVNGQSAMCYFPPGRYSNVTIIWQGPGEWPCRTPAGVKVTRDIKIWNEAKIAWLKRYGCSSDGSSCPFTSK